jgi:hypothetical protein
MLGRSAHDIECLPRRGALLTAPMTGDQFVFWLLSLAVIVPLVLIVRHNRRKSGRR